MTQLKTGVRTLALSDNEQKLFGDIERALADDPEFVAAVAKAQPKRRFRPKRGAKSRRQHGWLVRVILTVVLWRLWQGIYRWIYKKAVSYRAWYNRQTLGALYTIWGLGLFVGIMWYILAICN